ncbi:MAG: helix-turn-helix transcriptional regulator [Chloroflexi bacterium HGW-Chloroflexi-4]|jgi:LuxR family maltose regulon positive regulatory protein|nr:MAG: helix-turn-helix transcriptional regulator [Chloroflexi bacterium HGW-Chloroflexi-4]
MLSEPLLLSKLYSPPIRPNVVSRHRLVEKLNAGRLSKLTLISAPAGFGKTSLLSEWIAESKKPAAWLSLDEGDSELNRFLSYFVKALQSIEINIRKEVLDGFLSRQSQSSIIEPLLIELLNEISSSPTNFIFVLDDYHLIDSRQVDQTLTFLIENLPPQMQLVIATREDPPLSLARLRMRGQLTELRATDLRFTSSEAATFLNQMMGFTLREKDIQALETRTEGWIAGLQLAALSMQGRSDTAGFIKAFTGSHRFVVDYLVSEVLDHQPDTVRRFLLETSILNRLSGSLCEAVTEQAGGKEMLETLERGNLFVIPLDDQRQWFRYHHLFSDVLQAHLLEGSADKVFGLHKRACAWFEQNGFPTDAIHHALEAEDYEHAAELIELIRPEMDLSCLSSTWLGWVKKIPDELVRIRPVLSVGYAWALLDCGEMEPSEVHLLNAERCLNAPEGQMVVVDVEQFRSLPATIATARAYRSLTLGDVPGTVRFARQALELIPEGNQTRYSEAISLLGLAQYTNGDLEEAERSLTDFYIHLQKTDEMVTLTGIAFLLADIKVTLGRLRDAESTYRKTIRHASRHNEPIAIGVADLYRGLGELYIQWNDLEKASQHLQIGQQISEQAELTDWKYRYYISQAFLYEAQGDFDGALDLIDEAERVHIRGPLPEVRPIEVLRVHFWLKQGKLTDARSWACEHSLSVEDDLSFMKEFEYITFARLLFEIGKNDQQVDSLEKAIRLLDRLLQEAEKGHRQRSIINILLLRALVFQSQKRETDALIQIESAICLAESEDYILIFINEGVSIQSLIEKLAKNPIHPFRSFILKLQAAFSKQNELQQPTNNRQKKDILDPLSERELEVLKLLRSELSGPEIAQHLVVSLNTLRTHTKNIFSKLQVNTRRAAIRRAEELDLI